MKKPILVAPSILSADFSKLADEIKKVEDSGADMIHIDVMDGCFVPNITIGPLIVKAVRKCTQLPLDVHLMIEAPRRFVKEFVDAGADIITVHAEPHSIATSNKGQVTGKGMSKSTDKVDEKELKQVLSEIKSLGKKAGVSLNPDSPFCIKGVLGDIDMILIMSVHPGFGGQSFISQVLPKIKQARKAFSGDIEVDGGVNDENVRTVIDAGANIIVAGSYFFSAKDPVDAVKRLRG